MKVLVTGAAGMLGRDVVQGAPEGVQVIATDAAELDITDSLSVRRAVDSQRPDWIINCAAYTAVDRAESEPQVAERVNHSAVRVLASACESHGARLCHVSTDYVFAGDATEAYREDDPVGPINRYGATKLAGEQAALAAGALIVRTQWLFGVHGKSFPRTMWDRANAGQPTRVVDDQVGRPTYTVDLAAAAWSLIESGASGVFHVTNAGPPISWFALATRIFEAAGRAELLSPCGTEDYPTPARRPTYSALDTTKLAVAGLNLPPWQDAVDRFLGEVRTVALLGHAG